MSDTQGAGASSSLQVSSGEFKVYVEPRAPSEPSESRKAQALEWFKATVPIIVAVATVLLGKVTFDGLTRLESKKQTYALEREVLEMYLAIKSDETWQREALLTYLPCDEAWDCADERMTRWVRRQREQLAQTEERLRAEKVKLAADAAKAEAEHDVEKRESIERRVEELARKLDGPTYALPTRPKPQAEHPPSCATSVGRTLESSLGGGVPAKFDDPKVKLTVTLDGAGHVAEVAGRGNEHADELAQLARARLGEDVFSDRACRATFDWEP